MSIKIGCFWASLVKIGCFWASMPKIGCFLNLYKIISPTIFQIISRLYPWQLSLPNHQNCSSVPKPINHSTNLHKPKFNNLFNNGIKCNMFRNILKIHLQFLTWFLDFPIPDSSTKSQVPGPLNTPKLISLTNLSTECTCWNDNCWRDN